MRIKNKLFPYPILINNINLNNFNESKFLLEYEDLTENGLFILNNIFVKLTNPDLEYMFEKGILKCCCIIECPQSMYRKNFEISTSPKRIEISLFNLIGKVEISAFLYAVQSIENYSIDDFEEEYQEYKFDIDKYCMLAIDNGFRQRIDYDNNEDKKKSSIFVLLSDPNENSKTVKWTYDEKLIKISVPKLQHSEYDTMKSVTKFKNTFLSMFAVTPLSFILSDFVKEKMPVAELEFNFKWFKSFNDSYEKVFSKRLNDEEFLQLDNVKIYEIVQEIFEHCIINGVDSLYSICTEGLGDTDEN